MATSFANFPHILEIENDLRYLIEALATDRHSDFEEHKKISTTYRHLVVTYKAFNNTIKQTEDVKEECYIRLHTQAKCHKKFMNDLDIAWSAYDALANAVKDIETEIVEWRHTNPNACVLDRASQRTQKFLALVNEREIADRAHRNSDRLCADMTELAEQQREELVQLEADCQEAVCKLALLKRISCMFDLVVKRVERDIKPLLEVVEVEDGADGREDQEESEIEGLADASAPNWDIVALFDISSRLSTVELED